MDKETLSNYGWIVICVMVLAVMLAFASPFGNFIANAIKSTTQGLFDVNQGALDSANIHILQQEFENMLNDNEKKYILYDTVEIGDYSYVYMGCESYDEYAIGTMNSMLDMMGTESTSREDTFEQVAQLTHECSWKELQEQGYTEESFWVELGLTTDEYDRLRNGDYFFNGWDVTIIDREKASYGPIQSQVDGIPVLTMHSTFIGCTNLEIAPEIPYGITDMTQTFYKCTNLKAAPEIPDSVTVMMNTFYECTSLEVAPIIPSSVTDMDATFQKCSNLKTYHGSSDADGDFSNYTIPSNVTNMGRTFYGCEKLTTAPVIPKKVTNLARTFEGCTSLAGTITINTDPTVYVACLYDTQITAIIGETTMADELMITKTTWRP